MPHDPAHDDRTPAADERLERVLRDLAVANDLPSDAEPEPADRPPPGTAPDRTPPPPTPPHGCG